MIYSVDLNEMAGRINYVNLCKYVSDLAWKKYEGQLRTGIAVLLVPLMAGIGYELIKLAGRHDNVFTRIISAPGLLIQRITTKEPDDSMIECAIAAVKEVIPDDGSDRI